MSANESCFVIVEAAAADCCLGNSLDRELHAFAEPLVLHKRDLTERWSAGDCLLGPKILIVRYHTGALKLVCNILTQ